MDNHDFKQHQMDKLLNDDNLIILEALIPYVDKNLMLPLAAFVKISQLKLMVTRLSDKNVITALEQNDEKKDLKEILITILPLVKENKAKEIKNIISLIETMNTVKTYSDIVNAMKEAEELERKIHPENFKNNSESDSVKETSTNDMLTSLLPLLLTGNSSDSNDMLSTVMELMNLSNKNTSENET